jgi:hypothetical protein
MEIFNVHNKQPGGPVFIERGLAVTGGKHITLGSTDNQTVGNETNVPFSTALQETLGVGGEQARLTHASVMRSATSLKFLAKESIAGDKEGAVLVRICVSPAEGQTVVLTKAEVSTSRCYHRGNTDSAPKTCDDCSTAYVEEQPGSGTFRHPNRGDRHYFAEHLPHQVSQIGEGAHLSVGRQTHKELLAVLEPGARLRIATLAEDKRVVEERVLVRTHTELDFARDGDVYLASELCETNAAYV